MEEGQKPTFFGLEKKFLEVVPSSSSPNAPPPQPSSSSVAIVKRKRTSLFSPLSSAMSSRRITRSASSSESSKKQVPASDETLNEKDSDSTVDDAHEDEDSSMEDDDKFEDCNDGEDDEDNDEEEDDNRKKKSLQSVPPAKKKNRVVESEDGSDDGQQEDSSNGVEVAADDSSSEPKKIPSKQHRSSYNHHHDEDEDDGEDDFFVHKSRKSRTDKFLKLIQKQKDEKPVSGTSIIKANRKVYHSSRKHLRGRGKSKILASDESSEDDADCSTLLAGSYHYFDEEEKMLESADSADNDENIPNDDDGDGDDDGDSASINVKKKKGKEKGEKDRNKKNVAAKTAVAVDDDDDVIILSDDDDDDEDDDVDRILARRSRKKSKSVKEKAAEQVNNVIDCDEIEVIESSMLGDLEKTKKKNADLLSMLSVASSSSNSVEVKTGVPASSCKDPFLQEFRSSISKSMEKYGISASSGTDLHSSLPNAGSGKTKIRIMICDSPHCSIGLPKPFNFERKYPLNESFELLFKDFRQTFGSGHFELFYKKSRVYESSKPGLLGMCGSQQAEIFIAHRPNCDHTSNQRTNKNLQRMKIILEAKREQEEKKKTEICEADDFDIEADIIMNDNVGDDDDGDNVGGGKVGDNSNGGEGELRLKIVTKTCGPIKIGVKKSLLVSELKDIIVQKTVVSGGGGGRRSQEVILHFDGDKLKDDSVLEDLDFEDEDQIECNL